MLEAVFFYFFAGLAVISSLFVVLSRRPTYSVLSLLLVMFSIAALFAILGAYFVAVIQILVYAGSIVVLFLFVIMLLDLDKETAERFKIFTRKGAVLFLILILIAELVLLLARSYIPVVASVAPLEGSTIEQIGALLFSKYIIPFELTSFLILAAIIAAVTLAKQEK